MSLHDMHENDVRSERTRSGKSVKSSSGSRASINVTLPSTSAEALSRQSPVQVRKLSADKQNPDGYHSNGISPSNGTIPPQGTPTGADRLLSDKELTRLLSVRIIERAWLSFRDRQMFKLLKHSICAAEHSLSTEILRKVCPKEAELLQDKCMRCKVRFRFGGSEFPPLIFFKVFSSTVNGMGVKYVSGRKMIQPASSAARDACDLMGARNFYGQVLQDTVQYQQRGVTDETDVTTLKDYMQYLSFLDETPAYMGGKENSWRKLTLEVLSRQTIFYDVVAFLYSQKLSPELEEALPNLLVKPISRDIQLIHMNIMSKIRLSTPSAVSPAYRSKAMAALTPGLQTGRRSQQAQKKIRKMRQLYELDKGVSPRQNSNLVQDADQRIATVASQKNDFFLTKTMESVGGHDLSNVGDDELDQEAQKLYEWTQELSMDEIAMTPRILAS